MNYNHSLQHQRFSIKIARIVLINGLAFLKFSLFSDEFRTKFMRWWHYWITTSIRLAVIGLLSWNKLQKVLKLYLNSISLRRGIDPHIGNRVSQHLFSSVAENPTEGNAWTMSVTMKLKYDIFKYHSHSFGSVKTNILL